ncbi:MAG TPA: branched-chain amino acid ABC transporter permease [Geminicoccaceae bacterium]|nr:branched-chain amino acid ABC transporter permease [Geminicoccaceae bacterium]
MDLLLLLQQILNGLQLGVMLFLMAAGLTLVFGIMDLINLAHGSFYMLGAYLTASLVGVTGGFVPALALALLLTALVGIAVEVTALGRLYARDHLYQVLATFGLILFFNELVAVLFGRQPLQLDPPAALARPVMILGVPYPAFRLAIIAVGAATALFLWWLIARTRLGMLIRAGADNREILTALGVDVGRLYTLVFALGCALAALAGGMAGPILSVRIGMGEDILILTFVVIVIGGIGSVRGALVGALLVGLADTLGRAYLPSLFGLLMERTTADAAGASIGSMTIYIVMALVLAFRPRGLFPSRA